MENPYASTIQRLKVCNKQGCGRSKESATFGGCPVFVLLMGVGKRHRLSLTAPLWLVIEERT